MNNLVDHNHTISTKMQSQTSQEQFKNDLNHIFPFLYPPPPPPAFQPFPYPNPLAFCASCSHKQLELSIRNEVNLSIEVGKIQAIKIKIQNVDHYPQQHKLSREQKKYSEEPVLVPVKKVEEKRQTSQLHRFQQKEGRNANSNLLRMFFRRLTTIVEQQSKIVSQIINRQNMKISFGEFKQWFVALKIDTKRYIRIRLIRKLFVSQDEYKQQVVIMRMLLCFFLRHEAHTSYLTSKKVRRGVMCHNLLSIRSMMTQVLKGIKPKKH